MGAPASSISTASESPGCGGRGMAQWRDGPSRGHTGNRVAAPWPITVALVIRSKA